MIQRRAAAIGRIGAALGRPCRPNGGVRAGHRWPRVDRPFGLANEWADEFAGRRRRTASDGKPRKTGRFPDVSDLRRTPAKGRMVRKRESKTTVNYLKKRALSESDPARYPQEYPQLSEMQ